MARARGKSGDRVTSKSADVTTPRLPRRLGFGSTKPQINRRGASLTVTHSAGTGPELAGPRALAELVAAGACSCGDASSESRPGWAGGRPVSKWTLSRELGCRLRFRRAPALPRRDARRRSRPRAALAVGSTRRRLRRRATRQSNLERRGFAAGRLPAFRATDYESSNRPPVTDGPPYFFWVAHEDRAVTGEP